MKEYRLFDISDFVMDDDFIRWVNKKKKADNDFWNNWLRQYPDKHMIVAEAKRVLESIGSEHQNNISEAEIDIEVGKLMSTISEPEIPQLQARPSVSILNKWWYAAAATLLMAVAGTAIYFLQRDRINPKRFSYEVVTPAKGLIESVNTSGKSMTVTLPDGSTVELASKSRIAYANDFGDLVTRDVYLSGEAFFNVTKNPSRPFRVFANEIVTKVLGTSFNVRSYETDTVIQVTVRTGKVSVYSQASPVDVKEMAKPNHLGGIILTPNQELVYQKIKEKFQKVLLENPFRIKPVPVRQKMKYEDASVELVFRELSESYGISIVYDNDLLKTCTVTADLGNENFYDQLVLICKAIGASYEVIDGQVVIQANGCD